MITIRPFVESDAESLLRAVQESVADVGRWMVWCHAGYSLDDAKTWIRTTNVGHERGLQHEFAVLNDEGTLVGVCGVNHVNSVDRFANLGYWIRSSQTGRGYATSAARVVVQWAFAHTSLNRLEIVVASENVRSLRVAAKIPAQREALLRKRLVVGGESVDAVMHSVVR